MTFTPFPSQVDDLLALKANNYTALMKTEMGGGKTVSSLMAVGDSGANQTLIIAPQSTHLRAWDEDAKMVLGQEVRVIGNGTKEQRSALSDFEWGGKGLFVVTPQLFTRADISMWRPDMLIVDECHMLNKAGSKGQKKLSGHVHSDTPISKQSGMRLALSGTPARNNFERMWSLMRFLWPEQNRRGQVAYDNWYGWLKERMTSEEIATGYEWVPCSWGDFTNRGDAYGKVINGVPHLGRVAKTAKNWLREKEEGRLFAEAPCVIQHFRREQCCAHHPTGFLKHEKPNESTRVVEISSAQKKIIKDLEKQGLAWLDEHPLVVDIPITLQQRIRQTCLGVPTLTPLGEYDEYGVEKMQVGFKADTTSSFADEVEDILEHWGDETAIIYMSSQKFASALTERLNSKGIKAFEFSGATSKTRTDNLGLFGSEYRVMVATIESVGTGTDGIQKVCKNEIWVERSVDETNNTQGEGRTDRMGSIGQTQRVFVQDDLGYAAGRYSKQMEKRLALARSTRVAVR